METSKLSIVCFSPTHTTLRTLRAVAQGIGAPAAEYELTSPAARQAFFAAPPVFGPEDLVLLGAPVYGGSLAAPLSAALARLEGNGARAVLLCLYGNRHYDEALGELYDQATARGFLPIAAGAFIGEHSFTGAIASDRPDEADLAAAAAFGARIREKAAVGGAPLSREDIPFRAKDLQTLGGHRKHLSQVSGPTVLAQDCIRCRRCIDACPSGTLQLGEDGLPQVTGQGCIKCRACARACPTNAVDFRDDHFLVTAQNCVQAFAQPRQACTTVV